MLKINNYVNKYIILFKVNFNGLIKFNLHIKIAHIMDKLIIIHVYLMD
jgi:hypothetical protein